ncbi:glycosyltransferase family 4 protein [Thioalkalicoccus limnaeus]|uniref:Glycosyltransferase family 4 protein n=1 Tax=Thioalkalicoccus limnaeus TaxID=120681 RepID=A0ABV4BAQ6_9GAMM
MKVLHVETGRHLYGGAQQVVYLLRGLQSRGIANILACPRGSDIARAARDLAEVREMWVGGDLDLTLVARLGRLIDRVRPDLIHLHSRNGADLMGGLAGRWRGCPVVLSRRVDNPEPRWLVTRKYRLYDRVVAISDAIGQVLLAEGLPPAKLRVVRSAVELSPDLPQGTRAEIAARLGLDEQASWLGVVAQLIPRKGHRYLIEALPGLLAAHPRLQVVFFGQGASERQLREQVEAARLTAPVRFVGFRDDLAECLPWLDLLVHPATMEGLGVALLQTAAAGVPIVASQVGGIPEVVRDGHNGFLVRPADPAALGAACRRLLDDPALRRQMGLAGRELIRRHFSTDRMVAGNLAVYEELAPRSDENPTVSAG